jgi:hypothetical protein
MGVLRKHVDALARTSSRLGRSVEPWTRKPIGILLDPSEALEEEEHHLHDMSREASHRGTSHGGRCRGTTRAV